MFDFQDLSPEELDILIRRLSQGNAATTLTPEAGGIHTPGRFGTYVAPSPLSQLARSGMGVMGVNARAAALKQLLAQRLRGEEPKRLGYESEEGD